MLHRLRGPRLLPVDFAFGVGNSDHQCEAYDPRFPDDIQDVWERVRNLRPRGQATDFWNRYPEDIELARSLGCRAFRFGIAWARLEPAPGQFDDEALAHYRRVVETIRAAGMEPLVTLHHFCWPTHVDMIADDFPSIFARYVETVVARLGDLVSSWITINEPNVLVYGYVKPWWERSYHLPPGLPPEATPVDQMRAVGKLMRNLFLAHTAARTVIKKANPNARVSANAVVLGLPVWLQTLIDRNVTKLRDPDDLAAGGHLFAERKWLERGDVDVVIATLTATRDRADRVTFSDVYFVAGQALLVKSESAVKGPGDLDGRVVAVVASSTAKQAVAGLLPRAIARTVPDYAAARAALDGGQVDAILADDTILLGIIGQHPDAYRIAGPRLTDDERYAAAVTKGNPELLAALNAAIRTFKESGVWQASYVRHFPGEPVPVPPQGTVPASLAGVSGATTRPEPTEPEPPVRAAGPLPRARAGTLLRRIQDRGHIVIAVKADVPGLGYRDPSTGELGGLEIDLAHEVARYILGDPNKVVFRPAKTAERLPLLRSFVRFLDPIVRLWGILSTSLSTNWWYLGMAGQLPPFICPPECVSQLDFVGVDYYWGAGALELGKIERLLNALASGRYEEAPVYPAGLYRTLKHLAGLFPGKELAIIENGSVVRTDRWHRARYIGAHVRQIQRARLVGMNVTGYFCWSITTNREWGSSASAGGNDFGLYHVDLDTDPELKRQPSESAEAYGKLIARRGA